MSLKGYSLNITARILWGWSAMYIAKAPNIAVSQVYINRVLWATVVLLVISLFYYRNKNRMAEIVKPANIRKTFPGAILIGINWFTVILCIKHGDIITVAEGFYTAPIIAIVLGYIFFKEHDGMKSLLALLLCIAGVAVILAGNHNQFNLAYVLLISLSSACYAALRKGNPIGALETNIIEGLIIFVVAALFFTLTIKSELQIHFSVSGYYFPILGLMTSIPMVLYISSLKLIKVNVAGYFQYITPSVMLIFGIIFLNSTVSRQMWSGFVLLWLAIIINVFPFRLLMSRRGYASFKHHSK